MKSARLALERAALCDSVEELAYSLVNSLKSKFDCARVSMGQVRGERVHILAVSGMDHFSSRSAGVQAIQQAMVECLDAKTTILCHDEDWPRAMERWRIHTQLLYGSDHKAILSIPLEVNGETTAVVTLEHASGAFSDRQVLKVENLLSLFAPAVVMLSSPKRRMGGVLSRRARAPSSKPVKRTIAVSFGLLLLLWFVFGTLNYKVNVPCKVAAAKRFHVAAPYEGIIHEAFVGIGDRVKKGQVLLKFDTRELQLERQRLETEIAALQVEVDRAIAAREMPAASLAKANHDALAVQLEIVHRKIAQASVKSPAAGVVIEGELPDRLKEVVPMGEPLLIVASDEGRYVELRIPEARVLHLKVGQEGWFVTAARPDSRLPCRIKRINPSTDVVEEEHLFLAEAELEQASPEWMKVGMDGFAKIETGQRRVWWIVSHRAINWLRYHLWI